MIDAAAVQNAARVTAPRVLILHQQQLHQPPLPRATYIRSNFDPHSDVEPFSILHLAQLSLALTAFLDVSLTAFRVRDP